VLIRTEITIFNFARTPDGLFTAKLNVNPLEPSAAPRPMSTSKTPYPTLAQAALFVLVGTIFGTGLQRGRVHEASLVIGQMTFQQFVMLKMFLTACATSICAFLVIERVFKVQTLRSTYREDFGRGIPAVITGSSLLGLGMTLTGSCPGTVFAQLGAGTALTLLKCDL
jgi:uncharacterized membrane protein YedE/YeeE